MLNLKSAIAANRFGLGARPGDAALIGSDPEGWLLDQIDAPAARRRTQPSADARPESAAVIEQVRELRLIRQAAQSARNNEAIEVDQDSIREYGRFIASSYQNQAASGFRQAITAGQPFRERLVRFWQNHFAISADKQPIGAIAGLYRDEALRPNITGNFRDLLTAAVKHPAMLLYLDNIQSIGPNSTLGRRAGRRRNTGLNENLAREILELHTLGVDGGYTQDGSSVSASPTAASTKPKPYSISWRASRRPQTSWRPSSPGTLSPMNRQRASSTGSLRLISITTANSPRSIANSSAPTSHGANRYPSTNRPKSF
jgi:uncharacterized protein (DUF1800 family)